jgi:hypothetical protein
MSRVLRAYFSSSRICRRTSPGSAPSRMSAILPRVSTGPRGGGRDAQPHALVARERADRAAHLARVELAGGAAQRAEEVRVAVVARVRVVVAGPVPAPAAAACAELRRVRSGGGRGRGGGAQHADLGLQRGQQRGRRGLRALEQAVVARERARVRAVHVLERLAHLRSAQHTATTHGRAGGTSSSIGPSPSSVTTSDTSSSSSAQSDAMTLPSTDSAPSSSNAGVPAGESAVASGESSVPPRSDSRSTDATRRGVCRRVLPGGVPCPNAAGEPPAPAGEPRTEAAGAAFGRSGVALGVALVSSIAGDSSALLRGFGDGVPPGASRARSVPAGVRGVAGAGLYTDGDAARDTAADARDVVETSGVRGGRRAPATLPARLARFGATLGSLPPTDARGLRPGRAGDTTVLSVLITDTARPTALGRGRVLARVDASDGVYGIACEVRERVAMAGGGVDGLRVLCAGRGSGRLFSLPFAVDVAVVVAILLCARSASSSILDIDPKGRI